MGEDIALEKVAAWMIANSLATGHGDTLESLLAEATWQIQRCREAVQTQNAVVLSAVNARLAADARATALEAALLALITEHPVFRSRPLGSEGSNARRAQEAAIAAEDRARAVLGHPK